MAEQAQSPHSTANCSLCGLVRWRGRNPVGPVCGIVLLPELSSSAHDTLSNGRSPVNVFIGYVAHPTLPHPALDLSRLHHSFSKTLPTSAGLSASHLFLFFTPRVLTHFVPLQFTYHTHTHTSHFPRLTSILLTFFQVHNKNTSSVQEDQDTLRRLSSSPSTSGFPPNPLICLTHPPPTTNSDFFSG
jgi:hypothetical protein